MVVFRSWFRGSPQTLSNPLGDSKKLCPAEARQNPPQPWHNLPAARQNPARSPPPPRETAPQLPFPPSQMLHLLLLRLRRMPLGILVRSRAAHCRVQGELSWPRT